jgi:hypothetical protein
MSIPRNSIVILLAGLSVGACDDPADPDPTDHDFTVVGTGPVADRFTSDLWVHGDRAYTGTWGIRTASGVATPGNVLNVWDVSDPGSPRLETSVAVDARTVNDVKITPDGTLGVITHEGSADGLNGVTLLDLTDPGAPVVVTRYTSGLTTGVHNVWIDGDYLYVAVDGAGQGLRILDISDPSSPVEVGSYYAGESVLHDVYVRDGLAFLSHWNAGLVVLDVGNGMAGGSPANPVEVSAIDLAGQTHNAWYWPAAGYVFVGEEDFSAPGRVHVVDLSDPAHPVEVATFTLPGALAPPHNFWLDEDEGILYVAWYDHGLRAVDVTGDLSGELAEQERELGAIAYGGGPSPGSCPGLDATCTWAPQLVDGLVYVSDMNLGLLVLEPTFP